MAARRARWQEHDFYDILGVAPDASPDEIKRGFRKIALTCHPDKVREQEKELATKRFQLIAEAYEVLSKPQSRQEYDELHSGQDTVVPPTKGATGTGKSSQRWQRCKGCFGRFPQKDLRRCAPACSRPVCFSCDSCSTCNKQPEAKESKEHGFIKSGMTFVAAYDACVFPAPHSWKVLYKIAQGTRVTVAGTPKSCDGDIMAPWQRRGWIDIVDLTITRPRPEPKPKSKTGAADSPDLLRRASKLAQDIGDTAQEYVKTGYDGSAQAWQAVTGAGSFGWDVGKCWEQLNTEKLDGMMAGENAPWLAGEAVRMASEAAGRFWETATWAVRRRAERSQDILMQWFQGRWHKPQDVDWGPYIPPNLGGLCHLLSTHYTIEIPKN
ncbi:Chaperone protein DnaJ 2 [Durusdinium trenchii]|uniref:Chaperone protein DnaJ 2 n=1 Tax=Durusdinium trenchii TaxID=1381693 RepID=A0ABP0PSB6_9DINO